jgi:hypothetical protein
MILVTFAFWINAQEFEEGTPFNEIAKNGSHWANCTINGKIHYDEDCFGWIGKFLTWVGLGLFIFFFLICGCLWYCLCTLCRIICCTENPREVIYHSYVYPTSYVQIP